MPFVYLIQPAELVGTDRYKIGMSNCNDLSRIRSYNNGTRYLCILEKDNPRVVEAALIIKFNQNYKNISGHEYFQCSNETDMIKLFFSTAMDYESTVSIDQVNATNLAEKQKHSVYRFLNQYTGSGQIKASIFYEQYVTFCNKSNDILTNRVFGKELNKHGIITKRTYKDGKCYPISSESIQLWKSNFII